MRSGRQYCRRLAAYVVSGFLCIGFIASPTEALLLDPKDRLEVRLSDGTVVPVHRAAHESLDYYYLPVNPRLAVAEDGAPEFLLWKFITDEDAGAGGVSGAVLNLQMTWGLDDRQQRELAESLASLRPGALLKGAVPLTGAGEGRTFRVVSASIDASSAASRVLASGTAPLLPGARAAVAARLSDHDAQLLLSTLDGSGALADLSLVLDFSYDTEWPAARGEIVIDWSRLQREGEALRKSYGVGCLLHLCAGGESQTVGFSEVQEQFNFLVRSGVISFTWDEELPDERLAEIEDAFFERFLDLVTESVAAATDLASPTPSERRIHPGLVFGRRFDLRKRPPHERRVQRIPLDVRLPVRREHQLLANLKDWYDEVKSDPRCVAEIRLDEPFYQARTVPFILDVGGEEIFEEAVHHVEIKLRRKRSVGRDYIDSKTIDGDYLRREGAVAELTYARAEAGDPDAFDYQVRWSLKSGSVYPADPVWKEGTWEGVVLHPPVEPRVVEFEADLDELEAAGFTRATAKVRYWLFGREAEETLRLRLRGAPLTEKRILVDRDSPGFAYRLVLQHRLEGALASPWESRINSNYLYAADPSGLLEDGADRARARSAGQADLLGGDERVMERFPELRPPAKTY